MIKLINLIIIISRTQLILFICKFYKQKMMNELPVEIKCKIIRTLPTYEIVKLRFLNKFWKRLIDNHLKIRDLIVGDRRALCKSWLSSAELVDCDFIDVDKFDCLKVAFDRCYFSHLRNLLIEIKDTASSVDCGPLISQLDHLVQLECLELIGAHLYQGSQSKINCINLKYLCIELMFSDEPTDATILTVNTPKLLVLKLNLFQGLRGIAFTNAIGVRQLQCTLFANEFTNFKNVEFLYCLDALEDEIDDDLLAKMPSLKEFHTEQERLLVRLFEQKMKSNRHDLKLYFRNVYLDSVEQIDYSFDDGSFTSSFWLNENKVRHMIHHYSKLADTFPFYNSADFKAIAHHFENIPIEFLKKFINLSSLTVGYCIFDLNQLLKVLRTCKSLKHITFAETQLNNDFFNSLPSHCPRLASLKINQSELFNFNFAFNLKNLTCLHTTQPLSTEFLNELLSETQLIEISCTHPNFKTDIKIRFSAGHFDFSRIGTCSEKFKNLKELSQRLNAPLP